MDVDTYWHSQTLWQTSAFKFIALMQARETPLGFCSILFLELFLG